MNITRRTDFSTGADGCCPICAVGSTCSNVVIQSQNPMLLGDVFGKHPCGGKHCRHVEICTQGYSKILTNGKPVTYTSTMLSHGDIIASGASSVQIIV